MKILIVSSSDIEGGAARAAYRLHCSLLRQGLDSQMLVQSKSSEDPTVVGPLTIFQKGMGRIRPALDTLPVRRYERRTHTLFSPSWVPFSGVVDRINQINPDIVHLHWVTGGLIRVEDIARIKSPIVWSLHDMWPFTGGCHYSEGCSAFKECCGDCKVLQSGKTKDLSRRVFLRKARTFQKKPNITIVGLSSWLADEATSSSLFSGYKVVKLPNPIDTQVFAPFDQLQARQLLNLPQDKKLVVFGAMGATTDPRKGYRELRLALQNLQEKDAELVVFGAGLPENSPGFVQKAHFLGRLHDDLTLRVLYSAADVMVVPSQQEAFGQTASEAMACGTPVVAFGITGLLDIVDHKENGYLAEPFNVDDLANGIQWVLNHQDYGCLSSSARKKITSNFDYTVVATAYMKLYESVLDKEIK